MFIIIVPKMTRKPAGILSKTMSFLSGAAPSKRSVLASGQKGMKGAELERKRKRFAVIAYFLPFRPNNRYVATPTVAIAPRKAIKPVTLSTLASGDTLEISNTCVEKLGT